MNILRLRFCVFFVVLIVFSNCRRNSETKNFSVYVPESSGFMFFDSVTIVNEFPEIYKIKGGQLVEKEIIGMWDFEIQDSLIIVSTKKTKGVWEAYKLPDFEYYGEFLSLGEGPTEFNRAPSVSDKVHFVFNEFEKSAFIYDFSRGGLLKLDFKQSKLIRKDSIEVVDNQLPAFLFDLLVLDSAFYFLRQPENMETQQNRYLDSSGTLISRNVLEKLNFSAVSNGLNFPLLASMTRVRLDGNTIVEMYFGLNYFNLYSLDGSLKKSIGLDPILDDISVLEKTDQLDRKFRFSDVRVYDKFFALLYLNEIERDFASERKSYPEILFFDWEGKPLSKFQFNEFFTSFDIDMYNQVLYTFDSQTDSFRSYDFVFIDF